MTLLGTAGLLATAVWLDTAVQRSAVFSGYPDRPPPGRGTNWLLVGSDSRAGLTAAEERQLSTGEDGGNGGGGGPGSAKMAR